LLPFLTETVATPTRSEGVAIYLRDRRGFRRVARESRPVQGHFEAPAAAPTETVATLDRTRDLVLCEEVMRERPTEERRQLHEELTRLNWSLVLPLISENTVIGLIAVGPKLSGDPFYPQDLDLLMTLANQAGVAVKNAQLYARVVLANGYINSIVATIERGAGAPSGSATSRCSPRVSRTRSRARWSRSRPSPSSCRAATPTRSSSRSSGGSRRARSCAWSGCWSACARSHGRATGPASRS